MRERNYTHQISSVTSTKIRLNAKIGVFPYSKFGYQSVNKV